MENRPTVHAEIERVRVWAADLSSQCLFRQRNFSRVFGLMTMEDDMTLVRQPWSEREIAQIKKMAGKLPLNELARKLNSDRGSHPRSSVEAWIFCEIGCRGLCSRAQARG